MGSCILYYNPSSLVFDAHSNARSCFLLIILCPLAHLGKDVGETKVGEPGAPKHIPETHLHSMHAPACTGRDETDEEAI